MNHKIVFILLFIMGLPLKSQYFEGGLILGFSVSQVDGDTYAGYNQPGLSGGFYTFRNINKNMDAILELKYTAKGARKTGGKDDPMLYHQKLRYIEMPVKLSYKFLEHSFSIETGLDVGYLFSAKGEFNGSEILYENDLRKYEFSWVGGLRYFFNDQYSVSMQYNYSLIPVVKYENTDFNYGLLARWLYLTHGNYNNVIVFNLQYEFGR